MGEFKAIKAKGRIARIAVRMKSGLRRTIIESGINL